MTASWVTPDACTLSTAEQPLRVTEFDDLFTAHLQRVEWHGQARLALHVTGPGGLVDTVLDLAARGGSCCSSFDFATTVVSASEAAEQLELRVRVPSRPRARARRPGCPRRNRHRVMISAPGQHPAAGCSGQVAQLAGV